MSLGWLDMRKGGVVLTVGFLAPNPINRFSFGDRTTGMKRDADGGLTIYLQAEAPASEHPSNWLPVPNGPFSALLRIYRPDSERIGAYTPPAFIRSQ